MPRATASAIRYQYLYPRLCTFFISYLVRVNCFLVGRPPLLVTNIRATSHVLRLDTTDGETAAFRELDAVVNSATKGLLDLRCSADGAYRGVYLQEKVQEGDVLLRIDLNKHCICDDDFVPDWFSSSSSSQSTSTSTNSDDAGNDDSLYHPQQWVVRLAAMLLDAYLSPTKSEVQRLWFGLLPDRDDIRASLPIHWSAAAVRSTQCRPLEIAVDTMFFARQQAVDTLWTALRAARPDQPLNVDWLEDVLDIVQTRVCQLQTPTTSSSGETNRTIRCLAPVFDYINHHPLHANAAFGVIQNSSSDDDSTAASTCHLVVTATRDISAQEEVFIHYGSSSTQPAWKCLVSYGFFAAGPDEEDLVPLQSYSVGRTGVPPELLGDPPTPAGARRLCTTLQNAVDALEVTTDTEDDEEENPTAMRLVGGLRQHHAGILQECIDNLQEWAADNESSSE